MDGSSSPLRTKRSYYNADLNAAWRRPTSRSRIHQAGKSGRPTTYMRSWRSSQPVDGGWEAGIDIRRGGRGCRCC